MTMRDRIVTESKPDAAYRRKARRIAAAYGLPTRDEPLVRLGPDGRLTYAPPPCPPMGFGDGFMCGALLGVVVLVFVLLL